MKHKIEIVPVSDILSYEDSKNLSGGSTPWEGRFLIDNATPTQLQARDRKFKFLCKNINKHNEALATLYTVCRLITKNELS